MSNFIHLLTSKRLVTLRHALIDTLEYYQRSRQTIDAVSQLCVKIPRGAPGRPEEPPVLPAGGAATSEQITMMTSLALLHYAHHHIATIGVAHMLHNDQLLDRWIDKSEPDARWVENRSSWLEMELSYGEILKSHPFLDRHDKTSYQVSSHRNFTRVIPSAILCVVQFLQGWVNVFELRNTQFKQDHQELLQKLQLHDYEQQQKLMRKIDPKFNCACGLSKKHTLPMCKSCFKKKQ